MSGDVAATFCATLVDEWVRRGVTNAVVCPGSRSTPMAVALLAHPAMSVHVHHDERAAGFMAMGMGLSTGRPAIVLTTSGTAAVELHPAVVEAHQAGVPLVAVTADRPPELQGVGAPQTIDQRQLFGTSVRWYVEPGPADARGHDGWRHLAADVVRSSTRDRPGPVHLNLAFREPLLGEPGELPPPLDSQEPPDMPRFGLFGEQLGAMAPMFAARRGVIVAGARACASGPDGDRDREAVLALAGSLGWPVLADHLSGLRVAHPSVVTTFDPSLRQPDAARALAPEVVLRLGGLLASRVTNEWLAGSGADQVGVDRWGACPDPDHVLSAALRAEVGEACRQLRALPTLAAAPSTWTDTWRALEITARQAIDDSITGEPAVAAETCAAVPAGGALVVSSSMPVRDLEWYVGARPEVRVLSNRGANGIDGVVSTAVGVAATGLRTVCLVGDVAFLHDSNALVGLASRGLDLAIVVIDNDGGGIFSFLPQREGLPHRQFERLFGTPHGTDLVALATAHGVAAHRMVDGRGALASALSAWRAGGGVAVLVVASDRDGNIDDHRSINDAVARAVGRLCGVRDG